MNNAPINEPIGERLSSGWVQWYASVVTALSGWRETMTIKAVLDFPSIAAQTQTSLTATLKGSRPGDSVLVTPTVDVSGVIFSGIVTANDTITIYAKNFSAGAIDPASQTFRIIIIQS